MKKENKNLSSGRKEFGNYILGNMLGEGTFSKVILGTHKFTNQNVAIKVLEKDLINDLSDTQRVLRQIHILKLVRHPNIVQLYQIIQTPKKLFLVMQYMENGQLFNYIQNNQRLKQEQVCRLFHQLINGIEHIHRIGVVHRDLKPQNLLLDYQMNLRIVDFGLSNTYKKNQKLKTACGSPCYAAPQMLKGQAYDGLGVDIWSAGVILFAMSCGYLPFQDNQNYVELYQKIMNGDYNITVLLSDPLRDLIRKILTVNPQHRLKLDQIRKHPWMTLYGSHQQSPRGIIIGYNKIPIDEKILNILLQKGIDIQKTQNCLQANRHNSLTTTYYLSLKKYIKQGGESICDFTNKNFDKNLIQPYIINGRRDQNIKSNILLISGNTTLTNIKKKSRQRLERSKQKQKQNKQPNYQKIQIQKPSTIQIKKSRANSKITKIDPKIQYSINYGRPSTSKSHEKSIRRDSQMESRLNRRYKEKFNQSLVSKSKDKINQNSIYQQQSINQGHQRSRINSSVTKATNRNQTNQVSQIIRVGKKKINGKKNCAMTTIKQDMIKLSKAWRN